MEIGLSCLLYRSITTQWYDSCYARWNRTVTFYPFNIESMVYKRPNNRMRLIGIFINMLADKDTDFSIHGLLYQED